MRAAASRLPWLLMGLILGVLLASSWRWAANVALGDTPRASFGLPVAENPPSQPAPSTGFRRPPPLPAAVPSIAAPPSLPGRPAPTPIFPESAVDAAVEPAPAVSPRVAPREGRPTADRATREAILDLRQALGNPLSGTALEGADSEEFAEALARVREEIAAHSSHDFEHAAAPATEATSQPLAMEQLLELRRVARSIDELASDLEDACVYTHADQLRELSRELREPAREASR
jgi:hypothetical protein